MKKAMMIIFVCFLIINFTLPTMAYTHSKVNSNIDIGKTEIVLSDRSRLEIEYLPSDGTRTNKDNFPFIVREYNDNMLTEIRGYVGSDIVQITNYIDGNKIDQKTKDVSDIVTRTKMEKMNVRNSLRSLNAGKNKLGSIIYNKAYGSNEEKEIIVYSKITDRDMESYEIHAEASSTVSLIVSSLVSKGLGAVMKKADITSLVITLVSGLGGIVANGIIGIFVKDTVAVEATYYTLNGYYSPTGYYSPDYEGVARQVKTKKSNSYNKWFYEGYTPHNWKDGPLANMLYLGTFGGVYPYVKEYR